MLWLIDHNAKRWGSAFHYACTRAHHLWPAAAQCAGTVCWCSSRLVWHQPWESQRLVVFFLSSAPCPRTGYFPAIVEPAGNTCLCCSRWSRDSRLCDAAVKVQADFLPCWSCSGGRNLQQSCGAQLCLKMPLKDLLEYVHQSPNCSFCIVVFEGLGPLAIAVWGLLSSIDPYPERKFYRSLDAIHMYTIKNAVEICRHGWWINLLHQEDILHHVLACSSIFSTLTCKGVDKLANAVWTVSRYLWLMLGNVMRSVSTEVGIGVCLVFKAAQTLQTRRGMVMVCLYI